MGRDEPGGTVPPFSLLVSPWVAKRARDMNLFMHGARPPMSNLFGRVDEPLGTVPPLHVIGHGRRDGHGLNLESTRCIVPPCPP
eukprot:5637493-Heterocapsa_arctica.AAC.1